jgi:hypothetical protein
MSLPVGPISAVPSLVAVTERQVTARWQGHERCAPTPGTPKTAESRRVGTEDDSVTGRGTPCGMVGREEEKRGRGKPDALLLSCPSSFFRGP